MEDLKSIRAINNNNTGTTIVKEVNMKILPLTSVDIVNRYQIKNNRLLDTFENKVLKQGSKSHLKKVLITINRIGKINSNNINKGSNKVIYYLV